MINNLEKQFPHPDQTTSQPPKVLAIAGSDSGGAAGLQADLKTFTALGVYGMSVLTIATAQNSVSVNEIYPFPAKFVAAQIDAVLSDYGAEAVKSGFIGRVELIKTIASKLQEYHLPKIVIDPVLVDHRGRSMFPPDVTQAYLSYLIPIADLITPNRHEAALLTGQILPESINHTWLEEIALRLHTLGAKNLLIKGGRIGDHSVDIFSDGLNPIFLTTSWIETQNTHGSGDTLSAAVTSYLAKGIDLESSIKKAHQFTAYGIQQAATWKMGSGHGPIAYNFE